MKRLLKQAEQFVYKVKSPVVFSEQGDNDTYDASKQDIKNLDYDSFDNLKAAVKAEMDEMGPKGLAEYIQYDDRYTTLNEAVTNIEVTVNHTGAEAIVKTNRELTSDEEEKLKDYISGQYSDGWGEGFEQREVASYTSQDEEQVEETDEDGEPTWYTENVETTIRIYVHFWNHNNWNMTVSKA